MLIIDSIGLCIRQQLL